VSPTHRKYSLFMWKLGHGPLEKFLCFYVSQSNNLITDFVILSFFHEYSLFMWKLGHGSSYF
jgi:hypothetical protein